jgi:TonB family protein
MRDVQILKSAGYGMDDKAIEAVRKWRFRPGTKEGKPVDVRIQVGLSFSVAPEKNTWGAGPLLFDRSPGFNSPILKSGSMPKAVRQSGGETVVLQFIVNSAGDLTDVHALYGENSTSLPALIASVSNWKFAPASDGNTSVSATGKVLLVKGEDQFRYQVASAFRDTGKPEPKVMVALTNTNLPPTVIVVPVKIRLDADEANKQLVHRVEPTYPPDAKAAGIEGKVILEVTIGIDGKVSDVQEITGPKELMPAAVAAVKQWEYSPTIFRGRRQVAIAEVEVHFEAAK